VVLDSDVTVREYMPRWLDEIARHRIRASTYASYEQLVRSHIVPCLGAMRLQKLERRHIQAFYASKLAENGRADGKPGGLSRRMVRFIHAVFKMACTEAVSAGLLAHNPMDGVKPPRDERPPIEYWNADEAATFLAAAEGDIYGAIWHVALHTGLRVGELSGLRWEDVNLDSADDGGQPHPELRVRQILGKRKVIGDPKSGAGKRAVALDAETAHALTAHRRRQTERRELAGVVAPAHDLVFPSTVDTLMSARNLARHFSLLVATAGVKPISPHGMRHTHATLLMLAGVNPKIVSERLGHSDIAFTLRTYSHVLPQMQNDAAQAFAATMARASQKRPCTSRAHEGDDGVPEPLG